jgi:two-component system response regulator MprA
MAHSVLLVEDDEDLSEALQGLLTSQGFDVICARDGLDAVRLLWRGLQPCLILLDLMLPRIDGFAFREYQRTNPPWNDIPIIVISALDDVADRRVELQPLVWFKKPLDVDALAAAVARYC